MRALVIDDSSVMRSIIKGVLEKVGYEVTEISDGSKAVSTYEEFNPNIVTLDLIMPLVTGIDVAKKLMETDPDARIIMISGLHQKKLVVDALNAGVKDFLIKPFEEHELINSVKNCSKSE